MFAHYSPLFTSGLLSESNTPSASRQPSREFRQKEPRESLPVDVSVDGVYETFLSEDDALVLTFMPRRRRAEAGNSFLSLDLAESQSLRSMSLRRKDTVTSRATTHFGRSAPASPVSMAALSPPMTFASFSQLGPAAAARKSVARRSSKDSLPGVKPAPSSQLPAVPAKRALTLSTSMSSISDESSSSCHRSVHSEPSILSPTSSLLSPIERAYYAFTPSFSPPTSSTFSFVVTEPPRTAPLYSRPSMRSTASFRTRQVNRSAALAALEGRAARKARPRSRPNNFMSMSDDEDDVDLDDNDATATSLVAAPVQSTLLEVLQEEEDVVVPARPVAPQKRLSSQPSRKGRSRRGTLESLLSPLTNFIDFKDEDGSSRSWRSFVEIS